MTSLLLFHSDDAGDVELRVALTRAGVPHHCASLDEARTGAPGSVILVRLDPTNLGAGGPSSLIRTTTGDHRFLLAPDPDDPNRFRLAEALLPDRPCTRHRIALHAGGARRASPTGVSVGIAELPARLIDDGTAAVRVRLTLLASMQSVHVLSRPTSAAGLAVVARAATDCAVAVGTADFAMQLIAYRRVRGWLDFQRIDATMI